jgi:mono/diheme cytochrome c family protein
MKKIIGFGIVVLIFILAAYHAVIYYDNNFRYGRMRETPAVRPHEDPLLIMEPGIVPVSGGEALYRIAAGADLNTPVNLKAPVALGRGKAVYFIYCAQCHGNNYDGNGTVGQSFQPLPMDLRNPKVQNSPHTELFRTVSYGIPGGRQPALNTTITVNDRWSVVAYVKSLGLR